MEMCARPGAVTDDDLVAYAYDEAPPEVVKHVQSCPACAQTADEHRRFQARISAFIHRLDCPSPQTLGEYHLRLLAPEQLREVAGHIAECPVCADEARVLNRFLANEPAAPVGVIEQVRRLIATLMTPAPETARAGVRGEGDPTARTYQVDDLTIDLHIGADARSGRAYLSGRILRAGAAPDAFAGRTARLINNGYSVSPATIGDLGEFSFEAIEPGIYRLEVALSDRIVVIEELMVDG